MSAAAARWTLVSIKLHDFLGFQGEHTFEFGPGLQVLEASNHTGKSSLAMGLLWGLTGQIPALARLNRQSYRLSNKHAGENAKTGVVITLQGADGRRMEIRRPYAGRTRGAEDGVAVTLGDEELAGEDANARILEELGVSESSLEGCGVVLQDLRLKLITGKDSEIGEVINDMLGLEALSEVVPVLEAQSTEAEQLKKQIESFVKGGDPLQRWMEDGVRIAGEIMERENRALARGFDPLSLEDPEKLVPAELAAVAATLEADPPGEGAAASVEVERLRKHLSRLRKASPLAEQLSTLAAVRPPLAAAAKSARKLGGKWADHDQAMTEEARRGDVDLEALSRTVAECDTALIANKTVAEEKQGVQELLTVAYDHLLRHPATDTCPLCESKIAGAKLGASVRSRLDAKLVAELEALAGEEAALKSKKKKAEKRRSEVQELTGTHTRLTQETQAERDRLSELGEKVAWSADDKALFADVAARASLMTAIENTATALDARVDKLREQEASLQEQIKAQEESQFQPLEERLNGVRDELVPLLEAVRALEGHGKLRKQAEQRSTELEKIQFEARDMAGRLKKIAGAVSDVESDRATAAIRTRLPAVSEFFAKVVGNPDFTGLHIETNVTRNKVTYSLRATSSKMAALGDVVGHALSEGDMSAAGMALLLGLASGDSHRLGFLLLDDPAQGMDPTLQRNFARELAQLPSRPQVIILTHQPDFAEALAGFGADRRVLGRWEGGRLVDA